MNRSFGGSLDCNSVNYNKGKSFRFSEWNSSTLYSNDDYIQDFVSYMGSMYACIQTNTAVEPTNELYWKLVVSGQQGIQGKQGNTGVTFTPHVDADGNLSWTNDGGLENPQTVNIKGPKGADSTVPGPKGDKGDDGIGLIGPQGRTGEMGIGLEFNWAGTKLGVKRTVDDEYTYVDLKGTTGARGLKGNTGNTGPEGPQGPKGDSLYIQVSEPNEFGQRFLQKRYSESEAWVSFFDLSQMKGPKGDSIIVERNLETGNIEYRYQNQPSSANKILIYKDDIKGPKGDTIAKTYIADDGYLYIQLSGEDLPRRVGYVRGDRGADGREIVLRVYSGPSEDPNDPRIGTHLQWKYAGDEYKLWTNLIQINDLMNIALAGLKLEYNTVSETDETGITTKYEVIELSHYQVEFDENNNLVLTEKIANLSSVKVPTKTLLRDIKYDYDNNKLIFVFDTATGDETIEIDCDLFIRQGNGITISNGNIINVNISDDSDKLSDNSEILICDERGVAVRGLKDKLIKEFNLLKHDRDNNTYYYSYEYIAQDGTVYPISIPDFVEWNDNQDQTRQIFFRNQDKLVSWDINKIIRNLIHLDGSDIVQVGDSKVSINLNGKDTNPTYNTNEKLALISNLEDEIAGLHLVKEDTPDEPDIAARYYLVDKNGERLGDVHIDILKDNYLKDVTYNEDTYTFTFDFWVNDDPEEPAHDRIITFTLQKLFDNLKTLIDNLEAKHDSDIQTIRDEHKQDVKTLNETIATVNENLVTSVNNINQAMIDGFNTINGGINNEIRPAIAKNAEDIELLRENLEQETTDRKAADNILQSNIDAEVKRASEAEQMLQININSEINRALQAENLLQDNINTEVIRATNAEQTIQTSLDKEISRSKQVDQELIVKTDKTNQDLLDTNNNLSAEILRATNAESEIYDHIHEVEATIDGKIDESEKGQPNGVATLDENGFIPSTQINGQMAHVFGVDDVATMATLPDSANEGDIYYTTDTKKFYNYNGTSWDDPMDPKDDTIYNFRNCDATGDPSRTNILYRWDGENLTEISESLALGEVTGTAYEGNKGAANRAAINSTPVSLVSTLNISSDTSKVNVNLETATKSGLNYNAVASVVKNIPNATKLSAGIITSAEYTSLVETIPNKLVELETELNNKQEVGDYVTNEELEAKDYATKSEVPTKVSQLENDSNFLTSVPEEYVTDTELQDAISGVQFELPIASDLVLGGIKIGSGLSIDSDTGVLSVTGGGTADAVDWANVTNKPQINEHDLVSGNNTLDSLGIQPAGDYALKSEIPSLNGYATESWVSSQGYLTSIPSEYVTEDELNSKGYLTSVPDNYVTDNELTEAINDVKYTLPIASTGTLGGIKIGAGLSITEDGILSATGGGVADAVNWENVIGRPTNLSQFTNDSGYITSSALTDYAKKSEIPDVSNLATKDEVNAKQDILVSGTNIKTINGTSLLGSGNIVIEAGGGSEIMDVLDNKTYARTQGSWVDLTDYLTWAEYD